MLSEESEKHPSGSTDLAIVLELLDVPTPYGRHSGVRHSGMHPYDDPAKMGPRPSGPSTRDRWA
ncbi:hypothetical protein [Methanoculleus sp.]|uniref:hypothetical protein n=1 Tax=Methanoculleus sp. TaxID=90427 RepID=UPI00261DE77B|nr:hypothetical protein [Methanoculleus sp.]MDI6866978.1 hypothetical protein [Methanoculleus sp.]